MCRGDVVDLGNTPVGKRRPVFGYEVRGILENCPKEWGPFMYRKKKTHEEKGFILCYPFFSKKSNKRYTIKEKNKFIIKEFMFDFWTEIIINTFF